MSFCHELVVLHITCSMFGNFLVHAWRLEQYNILYQFLDLQTHFGMPRGAKMSKALNELNKIALHSKSNTTSEHATTSEKDLLIVYAKQPMVYHKRPNPNKKSC